MSSANDTVLVDGPVVRGPAALTARDKTPELTRIVRHVLKAAAVTGPLDRAIRSAARSAAPLHSAGENVDNLAAMLAHQINDLLGRRAAPLSQGDPHRETVLT